MAAFGAGLLAQPPGFGGIFGVQGEQQAQVGAHLHGLELAELVEVGIFRQAAVAQKGFDADHAFFFQLAKMIERIGNHAAPEGVVDQRVVDDGAAFEGEGAGIQCRWMTVERHVAHGRDPAGRRGSCAGDKAFPIGPARLVEVDVAVDHAR